MADAAVAPQEDEAVAVPLPPPESLDEAILRVQGSSQAVDLRRNADAEKGSARHRRYLDYPKLLREMRPVLQANSLTWQTFPTTLEGVPALRYVVTFVPKGERQEDVMKVLLGRRERGGVVEEETPQAQGSGLTYAKRYAFQGVFDLAPDGDDDGQEASRPARPAPADPEKPMSEENVASMLEAIAERALDRVKVFERVGIKDGEPILVGHGQQVKAILDAIDKQRAEAAPPEASS